MRVCLFDLNGTVLNDTPIWYESVKRVFRKFGKEAPSIGDFFKELETNHGDYLAIYTSRGVNIARDHLNAIYGEIYQELVVKAQPSTNAVEVIRELEGLGIVLGLITTQPEELASPVLNKFGLTKLFRYLRYHSIDKKTAITEIVQQEHVSGPQCYYVGDSPSDIRHANKANVVSVAFLDKHIPEDLVMAAKPRRTIRNFTELLLFT